MTTAEQYVVLINDMKRVINSMLELEYDNYHGGIEFNCAQSMLEQFIEDAQGLKIEL